MPFRLVQNTDPNPRPKKRTGTVNGLGIAHVTPPPAKGADCVLLAHMDGTDTGTTFTDSSASAHTITANGDANTATAQKKFGTASCETTESGAGRLSIPNSADFQLSADFTLDAWVYPTNTGGFSDYICGCQASSSESYYLFISASGFLQFDIRSDTSGLFVQLAGAGGSPTQDAWNHVAVTRSGNTYYLFLGGSLVTSATDSNAAPSPTGSLYIADNSAGGGGNDVFEGYIDEFRIRKGTAEWTSSFTPYTLAYT